MRLLLACVAAAAALAVPGLAGAAGGDLRVATFNASLNRAQEGQLVDHLTQPGVDDVFRRQARNVAEVVQRTRPDVLLINEFDYAPGAATSFAANFLAVSQNGAAPIEYPYTYVAPSNTGVASNRDLNGDGVVGAVPGTAAYANDALGFGFFPGQYGMAVFSRFPIDTARVRTFQRFLWRDMPGNLIPTPFYSPDEVEVLRLSSKSHWDVPIEVGGTTVHLLAAHPTPPVFDGPEDRNGRRNFDEIRFWADYVTPGRSGYIYDDVGRPGGIEPGSPFVIAGDLNSDPLDGDSVPGSAQLLLEHPLVNAARPPTSAGAPQAAALQGGANLVHRGDPATDTADFADTAPGNLRADYVLPRKSLRVVGSGVFWPLRSDPLSRLTGEFDAAAWGPVGGFPTSDHRLVWADLTVPSVR